MAEVKKEAKDKKKVAEEKGIRWYLVVLWSMFVLGVTCVFGLFYGISHEWFGDMPTFFLKYFPKKDCEGKCSSSDICCIVMLDDLSITFASRMTYRSIHSTAVEPVCCLIVLDRCLGVMDSLSA